MKQWEIGFLPTYFISLPVHWQLGRLFLYTLDRSQSCHHVTAEAPASEWFTLTRPLVHRTKTCLRLPLPRSQCFRNIDSNLPVSPPPSPYIIDLSNFNNCDAFLTSALKEWCSWNTISPQSFCKISLQIFSGSMLVESV